MDNTAYQQAKRHVERRIGLYTHLAIYLIVNSSLILFNLLVRPDKAWAFWPLFGWGIGLLFHGLAVVLRAPRAAWKQRLIEEEMKKIAG